ncbi:MAG: hypothetical protein QW103_00525 [Candidatus Pacearchaeota archaeon]
MFFKKRKKIIDLTELQRQKIIPTLKKEKVLNLDRKGFANMAQTSSDSSSDFSDPFLFAEKQNPEQSTNKNYFYKKIEIGRKFEEIDKKIYKLEQRIELLERKLNINSYY